MNTRSAHYPPSGQIFIRAPRHNTEEPLGVYGVEAFVPENNFVDTFDEILNFKRAPFTHKRFFMKDLQHSLLGR